MTYPTYIDANFVRAQIADLVRMHPTLIEDDEGLALSLESETDATELCTRLVNSIKILEAQQNGIAGYVKELKSRAEVLEMRSEAMRSLLLSLLEAAGLKKLTLEIATIYTTMMQHVVVVDQDMVPENFRRQPPWEPKLADIRAELRRGEPVPGCTLSNPQPSLAIRMK
jgi:Siphovirus Gp157